jgi:hypothetical protein
MRPYPRNSPQAAARIVALTLLADGQLQRAELASLDALGGAARLGLRRDELQAVMHDFCADLLDDARAARDDDCRITPALIELLLADIDDRALQPKVLALCAGLARADGRLHDGESIVLGIAIEQWSIVPPATDASRRRAVERPQVGA